MAKVRGLVVSDTHVGSIFGLCPPDFVTSDNRCIKLNPGQEYLWECWLDMVKRVKLWAPDFIVHNGDAIEGKQPKQRASELCLNLISDQVRGVVDVLTKLRDAAPKAKWYFLQGTEYHDGEASSAMDAVGQALGAEVRASYGVGRCSSEVLDLNVEGVGLNFAHHIGGATGFYRATPADREGQWSAITAKEGRVPKADVVVRSHLHYFVHVEHPTKHILITPCWQLQTRFMRHHSAYRMIPDIGAVLLEVNGEAAAPVERRVLVDRLVYALPLHKVTRFRP